MTSRALSDRASHAFSRRWQIGAAMLATIIFVDALAALRPGL